MACSTVAYLQFVLPDFLRLSWVTEAARNTWAPRFRRIMEAWTEIEWRAVAIGARKCAMVRIVSEHHDQAQQMWRKCGLDSLPLDADNTQLPADPLRRDHQQRAARYVVGPRTELIKIQRAYLDGNPVDIGQLLGYPLCCVRAFASRHHDRHLVDPIWPIAMATTNKNEHGRIVDIPETLGLMGSNMFWRRLGIRAIPHLPCRFDCTATTTLAGSFLTVGLDSGFDVEIEWLREILEWPVEWSALHGIAEIKSPLLRIITRTDATAEKYVVRWQGRHYPKEGANGIVFPYRKQTGTGGRTGTAARVTTEALIQIDVGRPTNTASTAPNLPDTDSGDDSL